MTFKFQNTFPTLLKLTKEFSLKGHNANILNIKKDKVIDKSKVRGTCYGCVWA